MNIRIQVIVVIGSLIAMIILLNMIRKKQLELRYALSWLGVGISVMILACFPKLLAWLAEKVGIASPVNMLFFFGFLFSLTIILVLTISISRMSLRVKRLAQEIALLRKEIEIGKEQGENNEKKD